MTAYDGKNTRSPPVNKREKFTTTLPRSDLYDAKPRVLYEEFSAVLAGPWKTHATQYDGGIWHGITTVRR